MPTEHIIQRLKQIEKSRRESGDYTVEVLGKEFIIDPRVKSPKYFEEIGFYAGALPGFLDLDGESQEKFLEIDSGAGIVSTTAFSKGAYEVTAVDKSVYGVANTLKSLDAHIKDPVHRSYADVQQSDLYSRIKKDKKFDTIFWDLPSIHKDKKSLEGLLPVGYEAGDALKDRDYFDSLEKSLIDPGYQRIGKFLKDSKDRLTSDGRLLLGFSSDLGLVDELSKQFRSEGYKHSVVDRHKDSYGTQFELIEARLK